MSNSGEWLLEENYQSESLLWCHYDPIWIMTPWLLWLIKWLTYGLLILELFSHLRTKYCVTSYLDHPVWLGAEGTHQRPPAISSAGIAPFLTSGAEERLVEPEPANIRGMWNLWNVEYFNNQKLKYFHLGPSLAACSWDWQVGWETRGTWGHTVNAQYSAQYSV